MTYICLDFETAFSDTYTLNGPNKLPIDNYVLDNRFHMHGVAIKVDDKPSKWFTSPEAISHCFFHINWSEVTVIAHNNYFDGFILSQIFGIKPKQWLCTMCMGRGLFGPDVSNNLDSVATRLGFPGKSDSVDFTKGKRYLSQAELERLGKYAINDLEICAQSFYKMLETYPKPELELIDLTLRMFLEPTLELDIPLLEQFNKEEIERKQQALQSVEWVYPYISDGQISFFEVDKTEPIRRTLASDEQFATLLEKLSIKVPMKKSKTTGEQVTAFSKDDPNFKKMLKSDNPQTKQLAEARIAISSTQSVSRSQALLNVGSRPCPVELLYCGAHSTRWSGKGGRNFQNFTKGSPIRKAIVAPKGYMIAKADSSQIEARLASYVGSLIAGTKCKMLEIFEQGRVPYAEFASDLFKMHVEKGNPETEREYFIGKQSILSLQFQAGGNKFYTAMRGFGLDLTLDFCIDVVKFYRNSYPEIVKAWYCMQDMLALIHRKGYKDFGFFGFDAQGIRLPNGLHIHYNDLKPGDTEKYGKPQYEYFGFDGKKKSRINIYGGKVFENLIQGLDRCIVGEQMVEVNKRYKVISNEHDSLMALVPEAEADEGIEWIVQIMSTPPVWAKDFPVSAEGYVSERYG